MNPTSLTLSPYVQSIVDASGLEVVSVVRYGPRYACLQVISGDEQGFLKIALPSYEQEQFRDADYQWTEFDLTSELERRLIKEAAVLRHLSTGPVAPHRVMKVMELHEDAPAWSVRTFLTHSSMSLNNSDFAFNPNFYEQVSPARVFAYFKAIHDSSLDVPEHVFRHLVPYGPSDYLHMLLGRITNQLEGMPAFVDELPRIQQLFADMEAMPKPAQWTVLAHGEPYPPHFYYVDDELMLIDWENATWNNRHADLAAVFIRSFPNPQWQQALLDEMEKAGYMDAQGRAEWEVELVAQCVAIHEYFRHFGPIVDSIYQSLGLAYLEKTIADILRPTVDA